MSVSQLRTTPALWLAAMRSRWALRRLAGESPLQLGWHMGRWLTLASQQSRWLRKLDASEPLRQSAQIDPRLYERWHRPFISHGFDLSTRQRIVAAHYDFLLTRFPAALRDRLLRGYDVRVTVIRLEDGEPAFVHLRKPPPGAAGELALLVQTEDRIKLASCVLTFAGPRGLLVGSIQDDSQYACGLATRAFIKGSHGLHPRDLLVSLLRELAVIYDFKRLRAASANAAAGETDADSDSFWQSHGATPGDDGCHDLPLSTAFVPCADGKRSRRMMQAQRETFRKDVCARFAAIFSDVKHATPLPWQARGVTAAPAARPAESAWSKKPSSGKPLHAGGMTSGA